MHKMSEGIYTGKPERLISKEIIRKHINFKTTFVKLCKSRNKRSIVNTVNDSVRFENCT